MRIPRQDEMKCCSWSSSQYGGWDSNPGSMTSQSALLTAVPDRPRSPFTSSPRVVRLPDVPCQGLVTLTPQLLVSHNPHLPSTLPRPLSDASGERGRAGLGRGRLGGGPLISSERNGSGKQTIAELLVRTDSPPRVFLILKSRACVTALH